MKINILLFGCIIVCLILVFVSYQPIIADDEISSKELKLFMFNSYIFLDFDVTPLYEPIEPNYNVNVPLEVKYHTNIPSNFLWFLPWQLKNLILFGSVIGPMQQIHLEVLNVPDWGDIYFTQPDILMDIPYDGDPASVEHTSLIIRLDENAPASTYKITIRATCDIIGRINAFSTSEDLIFTPQYGPCLESDMDNHVQAPPNQVTNIRIYLSNCGNALTRVESNMKNCSEVFSPMLNPRYVDLEEDEGHQFLFSVIAPSDFSGVERFELEFRAEIYPFSQGSSNITYPVYIYLYY